MFTYLGDLGELLGGGLSLRGLLGVAGEEDKLGLVLVEALHVEGKALLRLVAAAVVHRDTDGAGVGGVNSSGLCMW